MLLTELISITKNLFDRKVLIAVCNKYRNLALQFGEFETYVYATAKIRASEAYILYKPNLEALALYEQLAQCHEDNKVKAIATVQAACSIAMIYRNPESIQTDFTQRVVQRHIGTTLSSEAGLSSFLRKKFTLALNLATDRQISESAVLKEAAKVIGSKKLPEAIAFALVGLANESRATEDELDASYVIYMNVIDNIDPNWYVTHLFAACNRLCAYQFTRNEDALEECRGHYQAIVNVCKSFPNSPLNLAEIENMERDHIACQLKPAIEGPLHDFAHQMILALERLNITELSPKLFAVSPIKSILHSPTSGRHVRCTALDSWWKTIG